MGKQKFLLSHTPTTSHRVEVIGNDAGMRAAILTQETQFELDTVEVDMLVWFLQAVKADDRIRHTTTQEQWIMDYDPAYGDLEAVRLTRRATGRTISMARSTAYKLLAALTGETEQLVKESGEREQLL